MKHNIAKRYYHKHKELLDEKKSIWARENHQKCALYCAKRRSLKLSNGTFSITDKDIFRQLGRQNNECFWCHKKLKSYEMDHVIPLSKGGSHSIGNIVMSCSECNRTKSDRLPIVFKILSNTSNCKSGS